MELLSEPSDQALAAITQRNLRALLVTRSQLQALAPLIAALAGEACDAAMQGLPMGSACWAG